MASNHETDKERPPVLSSRVTSMKFMRRKDESLLRKRLASDQSKALLKSQWVLLPSLLESDEAKEVTMDVPFVPSRRSFNNFNPAVEDATSSCKAVVQQQLSAKADISDREMASRFQTLIDDRRDHSNLDNMPKKKSRTHQHPQDNQRGNFMKPKPI
uniref:Uncharacterized protein n=1 Tax=Spongospora subterranea TaxID=70186 RepID=A0A0H5RPL4_9EUKA|eukprot:CRZ10664.1 hypothetical protein [Spongospora subterranea]